MDDTEEPTAEPTPMQLIVTISPNGFGFSIPDGINPVTLSGIGWYLTHMAGVGVNNQLYAQAQAEAHARESAIAPIRGSLRDHLPKRGN